MIACEDRGLLAFTKTKTRVGRVRVVALEDIPRPVVVKNRLEKETVFGRDLLFELPEETALVQIGVRAIAGPGKIKRVHRVTQSIHQSVEGTILLPIPRASILSSGT